MINAANYWGRKAFRTGETNPFEPHTQDHRDFVQGRMDARELERRILENEKNACGLGPPALVSIINTAERTPLMAKITKVRLSKKSGKWGGDADNQHRLEA